MTIFNTCAQVISFVKELENSSGAFYRDLAQRYPQGASLLTFAQENGRFITQIERAYYGVITDAFEGCFAFNINPDDYRLDTGVGASYAEALSRALDIEQRLVKFYTDGAAQSRALMADLPRAFSLVARKRGERLAQLGSLLSKETP